MAHPSGVAVSADGKEVYVAETMANRIVRFVKQKNGVFLSSELPVFRVSGLWNRGLCVQGPACRVLCVCRVLAVWSVLHIVFLRVGTVLVYRWCLLCRWCNS